MFKHSKQSLMVVAVFLMTFLLLGSAAQARSTHGGDKIKQGAVIGAVVGLGVRRAVGIVADLDGTGTGQGRLDPRRDPVAGEVQVGRPGHGPVVGPDQARDGDGRAHELGGPAPGDLRGSTMRAQ